VSAGSLGSASTFSLGNLLMSSRHGCTIVRLGGLSIDIVIDTSALLAVVLNEPERPAVLVATRGTQLLAAPSLPWEVGNALIALRRRRRIDMVQVRKAWDSFGRVPLRLLQIDVLAALQIADSQGLYAYDGYVLEAARLARSPLVSLDRKLTRAAQAAGISVQRVNP
jgi:predicted nucleic acid-binding protein